MWIKKTQKELEETARQYDKDTLFFTLGAFFFVSGIAILQFKFFGYNSWKSPNTYSLSWGEVLHQWPAIFLSGIVAALGIMFFSPFRYRNIVLCPKCEKTKVKDTESNCSCGASFEELRLYKWVE